MAGFIKNRKYAWLVIIGFICIAIVALAMAGAVINYSPVPNADMWNGAIGFVLNIDDGNYSAWWGQHNEHRILLSRMFFWLDIKLFGGSGVFLITFNYFLVFCSLFLFALIVDKLSSSRGEGAFAGRVLLLLVISSLLFLWTQEGNLDWAFQCHFFLAQLLPLGALFWLAKSAESSKAFDFAIACVFGGASVWALANGILVLPLMILYSLVLGSGWRKVTCLVVLTLIMTLAYYYGYHSPEHHGHLLETIKKHPLDLLHYTMLYLGGGWYYVFGQGEFGKFLAVCAGVALVSCTLFAAWVQLHKPHKNPFVLALIFFIIYIGGTAFGAGGTRLIFGMDQALSSRYTTPSNMAWAALLIIVWYERYFSSLNRAVPVIATFFMSSMLVFQFSALNSASDTIATREVAALAAALDIDDASYIRNIFPDPIYVLDTAKQAIKKDYSIYGKYPYKGLSLEIGKHYDVGQRPACLGSLERVTSLPGVSNYVQVQGWLFEPNTKSSPKLIHFTGSDGAIVGFALTGGVRVDVKNVINRHAGTSGFTGYILSSQSGEPVVASGDNPSCSIGFKVRPM